MTSSEHNVENLPPEKLQSLTTEAYNYIPRYFPHPVGMPPEEAPARVEGIFHRIHSEAKPLIIKRFDELLAQYPTTASYKEAMHELIDHIYVAGRKPDDPKRRHADDIVLVESLQLENGSTTGIYTSKGARKGEDILYENIQDIFRLTVQFALEQGENLEDPKATANLGFGNPVKLKAFLDKWKHEYTDSYGEPPPELR